MCDECGRVWWDRSGDAMRWSPDLVGMGSDAHRVVLSPGDVRRARASVLTAAVMRMTLQVRRPESSVFNNIGGA